MGNDMTKNTDPTKTFADHMAGFFTGAEAIISDGLHHAREDDPHRFHAVAKEFDGGKARRQLIVDYLAEGRARVSLLLIGTKGGEEMVIEMFATTVQSPHVGTMQ